MFVTSNYEQMEAIHDEMGAKGGAAKDKNALQYKWPLARLSNIYTFVV